MFKLLIQHITSDMVITLLLLSSLHCAFMKSESLSVKCPTMALFTVQDPLGFTVSFPPVQWSLSPSGGRYLHRATRSAWIPAKVLTLFLSARERGRHRESQVCLLQFSFHPKITLDAHIADIMSCVYFWFAHIFQRWNIAQQWCRVCYVEGFKKMSFLNAVYLIRPDNTSCLHQCNPINELGLESDKCFPTALWCYINIPR